VLGGLVERAPREDPLPLLEPEANERLTRAPDELGLRFAASSGSLGVAVERMSSPKRILTRAGNGASPSGPSHGRTGVTGSEGRPRTLAIGSAFQSPGQASSVPTIPTGRSAVSVATARRTKPLPKSRSS